MEDILEDICEGIPDDTPLRNPVTNGDSLPNYFKILLYMGWPAIRNFLILCGLAFRSDPIAFDSSRSLRGLFEVLFVVRLGFQI